MDKTLTIAGRVGFFLNRELLVVNRLMFKVNHATSSLVVAITRVVVSRLNEENG